MLVSSPYAKRGLQRRAEKARADALAGIAVVEELRHLGEVLEVRGTVSVAGPQNRPSLHLTVGQAVL